MKNPFKRKSEKFPKVQGPRDIKVITQEYSELRAKAGEIQYRLYVSTEDLRIINERLLEVNKEGQQRHELDAELAKSKTAEQTPVETSQQ